jgi:phosphatidylinositol 4-kinase type 2
MFARQIAVMKGQAWNVVETLKEPNHGPLELTRRARVCVWDDLVDIPIAVPMSRPSAEMRRTAHMRTNSVEEGEEEMDISAANGSAPQAARTDLLDFGNGDGLPSPNRFDLTRSVASDIPNSRPFGSGSGDIGGDTGPGSPASVDGVPLGSDTGMRSTSPQQIHKPFPKLSMRTGGQRPGSGTRERLSYDGGPRYSTYTRPSPATGRRRGFSASFGGSARRNSAGMMYDGDDLEGDLGYAAAEDMEGNQRKVIVERLETVKSKNPVFTWC